MKPVIIGYEPDNKNGILTTERFKNVHVGGLFESIPRYQPTWWERLLLRFVKPYYSFDHGAVGGDRSVLIVCKRLRGKVHIIETIEL